MLIPREFGPLERAALEKFAATYGGDFAGFAQQLQRAELAGRENSGNGFFTDLTVDRTAVPPIVCPSPINSLVARVDGLSGELALLLFFQDGYAYLLEGYSIQGEDTADIDFGTVPVRSIALQFPKQSFQ